MRFLCLVRFHCCRLLFFFFFNDTATTEIYTLSLHDALPISDRLLLALGYSADVATDGTFSLLHVLPGKYWAVVRVDSDGTTKWSTRKVEVNVDGGVTGISP